jgi:hypothetical protein
MLRLICLITGISHKTEGTFPFYSPEMCLERGASFSAYMADTWAACVCLWIFVFGELPFYHIDVTELFRMIRCEWVVLAGIFSNISIDSHNLLLSFIL